VDVLERVWLAVLLVPLERYVKGRVSVITDTVECCNVIVELTDEYVTADPVGSTSSPLRLLVLLWDLAIEINAMSVISQIKRLKFEDDNAAIGYCEDSKMLFVGIKG